MKPTAIQRSKQDELTLALLAELKSLRAERDLYMAYLAFLMSDLTMQKPKLKIENASRSNLKRRKIKHGKSRT